MEGIDQTTKSFLTETHEMLQDLYDAGIADIAIVDPHNINNRSSLMGNQYKSKGKRKPKKIKLPSKNPDKPKIKPPPSKKKKKKKA